MDKSELLSLQELASSGNVSAIEELTNYYYSRGEYEMAFLTANRFDYFQSGSGLKLLGTFYQKGIGTEIDILKAIKCYERGLTLGDLACSYNLALLFINEKDYVKAISYLSYGVGENHIPSIKLLANLYLNGEGVLKNEDIAINLLLKAIELGDKRVADKLAKIYYKNHDYEKAYKYFSLGASFNDIDSIYHLALCHSKGLGVRQDFVLARKYYEIGANLNDPRCLYNLSIFYRDGIGVEINHSLSEKLYNLALENGFERKENKLS